MRSTGVSVVVEDSRGRVLLLRRGPTDPWMPGKWNLPGGRIDLDESPILAAMRETYEEANLRVFSLSPIVEVALSSGGILAVFYADHWDGRVRLRDGEHSRAAWVPREVAWMWDLVPVHREVLRQLVLG
jgi:8-oxo-dGTP pyrophosphatase MutT (NUDIX family)